MSWVAVAIGGSAVLGAITSGAAADAQSNAAGQALGLSRDQYNQNRADLAPWRTGGGLANQRLLEYLGLAKPNIGVMPTREQFTTAPSRWGPGSWNDRTSVWAPGSPSVPGGFDQVGYDKAMADYNARLSAPSPEGFGSLLKPFTGADLASEPGYQFGLSEGEKGINRSAAGRGSFDSGATLKALGRFGQDYAGTKYGEAFNRDLSNKNTIYGYLSGVSSTGANAAGQTAGLGANYANSAGQYLSNAGDARAAGLVGGANAITSGVGSYLGYNQNQQILDYLRNLRQPISSVPGAWGG